MKNYYFYFDEGGMFGNPKISIRKLKIENENDENDEIFYYFFGKLSSDSIIRHLQLFKMVYPDIKFKFDKSSDIKESSPEDSEEEFDITYVPGIG